MHNKLQLNPDKTEMILITSKHIQKSLSLPVSVDLIGTSIHPCSTVRNLGVTLDQNLPFQQHVSRAQNQFCPSLPVTRCSQDTDLCFCPVQNRSLQFLLADCPKQLIYKLQKVQNNAARLICRTPKSDHISPVIHTLHWLPVEQKIEYIASPCL